VLGERVAASMEVDSCGGLRAAEQVGDLRSRAVLEVVERHGGSLVGGQGAQGVEKVRVKRLGLLGGFASLPPREPRPGLPSHAASSVE
jgi:hypothetical protein